MKVSTRSQQLATDLFRQICCHPHRRQPDHRCAASTRVTVDTVEVDCPRCGSAREYLERSADDQRHAR